MPFRVKVLNRAEFPSFIGKVNKSDSCVEIKSTSIGCIKVLSGRDSQSGDLVLHADISQLADGDVVQFNAQRSELIVLYRAGSNSNALFVTDLCNSKCLMCPQPPKPTDSVVLENLFEQIKYLPEDVEELCITGGEPTLLKGRLLDLLQAIAIKNSNCKCHILTNGRLLNEINYVRKLKSAELKNLTFGIPLYSSVADEHDFIVQSPGAFDETISGIYNLASCGFSIEIRIVLHKLTVPGLLRLVDYIYNKMPYVAHVAFMGMEEMGYVKKNWDRIYISPSDYQEILFKAVRFLYLRGICCSIYNLPVCLTVPGLRQFLRSSISDYKVDYAEQCKFCLKRQTCPGLFHYQRNRTEVKPFYF